MIRCPFWYKYMKKSIPWKFLVAVLLIVLLLVGGIVGYLREKSDIFQQLNGKLQIHFLDVGQGDASLLILPTGERIMVDTGTRESGEKILAHLAKWKVDYIDYVILSHTHSDHAGGLELLEEQIGVGKILYSGIAPEKSHAPTQELHAGEYFDVGDLRFSILGPLTSTDSENRSLILRVDFEEMSILFTGDAESEEEELLLNTCPQLLDVDLLKVAHHGSKNSTSRAFLEAVTPDFAVISASFDNSYGHPAPETEERLAEMKCHVYSTHREGAVIFLSNGHKLVRYQPSQWLEKIL